MAERKESSKENVEGPFGIRVLRDKQENPAVILCKVPTPLQRLLFEVKCKFVGMDEVEVTGTVKEEQGERVTIESSGKE